MRLNKIITSLMVSSFMLAAEPQQLMADALAAYQQGNHVKAAEIYQSLALEGNTKAQFELAKLYSMGHGVEQDALQAAYWLEQAASNSTDYAESAQAQRDIAEGVEQLKQQQAAQANYSRLHRGERQHRRVAAAGEPGGLAHGDGAQHGGDQHQCVAPAPWSRAA